VWSGERQRKGKIGRWETKAGAQARGGGVSAARRTRALGRRGEGGSAGRGWRRRAAAAAASLFLRHLSLSGAERRRSVLVLDCWTLDLSLGRRGGERDVSKSGEEENRQKPPGSFRTAGFASWLEKGRFNQFLPDVS
jgi:hypothetical protein